MGLKSDINFLRGIWFFSGFADEQLRLIAFSAEGRAMPEGTVVYAAGDLLQSGYLVTSGRFSVLRADGNGQVNAIAEPGVLLAERALVVDMEAPNTVVADVDSSVLQIRRSVFRRFLDEYPEAAILLRTRLLERLKQSAELYGQAFEKIGDFS